MGEGDRKTPEFCQNQLRDLNHDRYLACLYLPENLRNLAMTLYAFDTEISKISSAISEPMTGEIRIQWWRDTVQAGTSNTHNPLADELLSEMTAHKLPLLPLDTYLQARIFDLYNDPMPDIGTLEGYCGETASVFIQLLTMAAKLEQDRAMADICGHAGMVLALTDIIRFLPRHNAQNKIYIPKEMLEAAGLSLEDWFSEKKSKKHMEMLNGIFDLADNHLMALKNIQKEYNASKKDISLILLPTSLCKLYLRSSRKLNDHIFTRIPTISPLKKLWTLWRAARTGNI
ncbi:MAG: phytoene/squalene synthase family protein [Rhizobiaceae bacterium]